MSIRRVCSFLRELQIPSDQQERVLSLAEAYSQKSRGMMHVEDLKALGAALVYSKPAKLFEIGTFRGNTADFCLSLLPNLTIVSIAHVAPRLKFLGSSYNNSHKDKDEIGCDIQEVHRSRFTQLYGDSHKLSAKTLLDDFGHFDFIIIDGDHSATGVSQDTLLASQILSEEKGAVCWHDANPKEKYRDVREFLEEELPVRAIATTDNFIGGIAFWEGRPTELVPSGSPRI